MAAGDAEVRGGGSDGQGPHTVPSAVPCRVLGLRLTTHPLRDIARTKAQNDVMTVIQGGALTVMFFAGAFFLGTQDSDPDFDDPVREIVLGVIAVAALVALIASIRAGRLKSEDVDEPVFSARFMHICPQCGKRMKLRRDPNRFLWYACPNCGLGMRHPDLAANPSSQPNKE